METQRGTRSKESWLDFSLPLYSFSHMGCICFHHISASKIAYLEGERRHIGALRLTLRLFVLFGPRRTAACGMLKRKN